MIAFTLDTDWVTESTLSFVIELFKQYKIKCTIFATGEYKCLQNIDTNFFEIGIHPNFNELFNKKPIDVEKIIDDLLEIYPNTKGMRSHSLFQATPFVNMLAQKGFLYEVNHFLPYYKHLEIFKLWNNLYSIPFNWEDDLHFAYKKSFRHCGLNLAHSQLNILNFHPIHVFMNTPNENFYLQFKPFYKNDLQLKKRINTNEVGTQDLLKSVFQEIKEKNIKTYKLSELVGK